MAVSSTKDGFIRTFRRGSFSLSQAGGSLCGKRPLVIVVLAMIVGIILDRLFPLPFLCWWIGMILSWLGALVFRRRGAGVAGAAFLLIIASAAGGAAWHHLRWNLFGNDEVGSFATAEKQPVCLEGELIEPPRWYPAPEPDPMRIIPAEAYSVAVLSVGRIRDGKSWRSVSGRVRLIVSGERLGLHQGERLRVFGQLRRPPGRENPGGFDAEAYHRSRRLLATVDAEHPDCLTLLGDGSRWHIGAIRQDCRAAARAMLLRHLGSTSESLAGAMLLGYREEVSENRYESMRRTGSLHILAISGMHVGLIAAGFYGVLSLLCLPRKVLAVLLAILVLGYLQLTDLRPSAVRATILVLVFCAGLYFGRKPWTIHSLALAAVLVLAGNPCSLFLPSAQLSFLAASALVWVPLWPRRRDRESESGQRIAASNGVGLRRRIAGAANFFGRHFLVSAVIWLVGLPLVMSYFHLVTPVAILVNPLIWIPLTLALMSGFVVMVSGFFCSPLAAVFGWVCDRSLEILQAVLDACHAIPGGYFYVPGPAVWWMIVFYAAFFLWTLFPELLPRGRRIAIVGLAWVMVGFSIAFFSGVYHRHRADTEVQVLSMGHGLCVVIHLPDGRTVLYDAGSFASPQRGAEKIGRALWRKGVTHLDAIVLSHADADHFNHLPALLDRFSVGRVYVSPFMFERASIYPAIEGLQVELAEAGVPLREMTAGFRFKCRDLIMECFHPTSEGEFGEDHTNSIVLGLSYRDKRILLPGDLEGQGRDALLMEEPWDCDVLLAPHHGSGNSEPEKWLAWCRPETVIISGSRWQRSPEIVRRFAAEGARLMETSRHGAVKIVVEEETLRVESVLADDDSR